MSRSGRSRRLAVLVFLLSLVLVFPAAEVASATPARAPVGAGAGRSGVVERHIAAALPAVSDLLRDSGLADLLSELLEPPESGVGSLPAALVTRVARSTVKVTGVACGARVEGSGFSAAPDTVVTNAHVVAGSTSTQVLRSDGRRLPAQVQVFDPDRDLALLAVPGLAEPPLSLGSAAVGEDGAVFGHPQGQVPVDVSPATVVRRVTAVTSDIYGEGRLRRQILVLAAQLEPGDSGGPLVNQAGEVVGVAFAVSAVRRSTAFAIPSESLAPVLAQPRTGAVSTGACLG